MAPLPVTSGMRKTGRWQVNYTDLHLSHMPLERYSAMMGKHGT